MRHSNESSEAQDMARAIGHEDAAEEAADAGDALYARSHRELANYYRMRAAETAANHSEA